MKKGIAVSLLILLTLGGITGTVKFQPRPAQPDTSQAAAPTSPPANLGPQFDGERALAHVAAQVAFGPRPAGSQALRQTGDYIIAELEHLGWAVETQEFTYLDTPIRNIIARGAVGQGPVVLLGAHYDTRSQADEDTLYPDQPTLGANDGGSGVAVLLELARALNQSQLEYEVWLAFFDAEDNGGIGAWDWIIGSSYMAENLAVEPSAVIVLDMIGDADQQIYFDHNSDRETSALIWSIATRLGYSTWFIPAPRYAMTDDHTPFARQGIIAVDVIDFDYPYWHTTEDTLDKVSAASLERVGRTIEVLLGEELLLEQLR